LNMKSAIGQFKGSIKNLKYNFEQSNSFWRDEASRKLKKLTLERLEGPHSVLLNEMEQMKKTCIKDMQAGHVI
jgi:hypothetical protein